MDFDIAANRLQRDQQTALAKSRASRSARETSNKVRREAALAKAETERRIRLRKRQELVEKQVVDATWSMIRGVENELGIMNVKSTTAVPTAATATQSLLGDNNTKSSSSMQIMTSGWSYTATSIYGDGDKISLPPSTLSLLTDSIGGGGSSSSSSSRPIAFRIGIVNPKYTSFPASATMRVLLEDMKQRIIATTKDDNVEDVDITNSRSIGGDDNMKIDDEIDDDNDDDDDAEFTSRITEAYLGELSHRYLSYTHGTVVEFTEDENHVGLPVSIAKALLQPNIHSLANRGRRLRTTPSDDGTQSSSLEEDIIIPSTRTVDPASIVTNNDRNGNIGKTDNDNDDSMNVESVETSNDMMTEKTPGHPAYNQFDIPSFPIEIIPLTLLPPGKDITFTPTSTSIQNGFYKLKDIKMVLEQSLVRSRATLSLGDVVKTWKRGVEYDLIVSDLNPRGYGVVSCVDTDLNVEFGSPDEMIDNHLKDEVGAASNMAEEKNDDVGAIPTPMNSTPKLDNSTVVTTKLRELIPEPPMDVKLGVCNSQIRGRTLSGTDATGRRRFDVASATLADLFDFASNVCGGIEPTTFRLVTRFPRRVFTLNVGDDKATLESVGISPGQEMFMVESI